MTNQEKLREVFPNTIFILQKQDDKTRAIMCSDEWLNNEYQDNNQNKRSDQEPKWIPIVKREPTEDEKAEFYAQHGEELCFMVESKMPVDGQEVLISIGEHVSVDVFYEDFYDFENNDLVNVDAWMPKPKSYKSRK